MISRVFEAKGVLALADPDMISVVSTIVKDAKLPVSRMRELADEFSPKGYIREAPGRDTDKEDFVKAVIKELLN